MNGFAGTTSQDLAVWKRADRTLLGFLLDAQDGHRGNDEGIAFMGVLPKGTPIAKFEESALEGHYECILGVNSVHLPVAAVQGTPHSARDTDPRATIPQRKAARRR